MIRATLKSLRLSVRNASAAGYSGQHFCVPTTHLQDRRYPFNLGDSFSRSIQNAGWAASRVLGPRGFCSRESSDPRALSAHLSDNQLAGTLANDGSEAPFAWLGGSDSASEGQWVWENNGDVFWSGDFNGGPVGGRFNNWGFSPTARQVTRTLLQSVSLIGPSLFMTLAAPGSGTT